MVNTVLKQFPRCYTEKTDHLVLTFVSCVLTSYLATWDFHLFIYLFKFVFIYLFLIVWGALGHAGPLRGAQPAGSAAWGRGLAAGTPPTRPSPGPPSPAVLQASGGFVR